MLIGLFDSGIGGLSVLTACKRHVPDAQYLYLDDCAYSPYGNRPDCYVTTRALENTQTLVRAGCSCVIIACNTATVVAAAAVRAAFPNTRIFGLEPAVRPALESTSGKVLLLATEVTARTKSYPDRVIVGKEKTLASEIELAFGDPKRLAELALRTIKKYPDGEVLVTGCSHYAHLIPFLPLPVFDGSEGVARHLKRWIEKGGG